jgi:hypothetical protein
MEVIPNLLKEADMPNVSVEELLDEAGVTLEDATTVAKSPYGLKFVIQTASGKPLTLFAGVGKGLKDKWEQIAKALDGKERTIKFELFMFDSTVELSDDDLEF